MSAPLNHRTDPGWANRDLPRTAREEGAPLVDRRRWTSFLTWAFVLAEMARRDALLPTAAHAGADDVGRAPPSGSEAASHINSLPNIRVSTATEGPEPITYQHAPMMAAYVPTALSSGLGQAKIAPAEELAHSQGAAGGGGGYLYPAEGMHVGGTSAEMGTHISLGQVQFGAVNFAGEVPDLGVHIDLGDTAHVLLDSFGNLPLVGGLGEDAGNTLASTISPLLKREPVVLLVEIDDAPSGPTSDVGSPGQLSFSDGSSSAASHELATPSGGYTNYGIALNLSTSDVAEALHVDAFDGLDSVALVHLTGSHFDAWPEALHLDQSVLRTASDILA